MNADERQSGDLVGEVEGQGESETGSHGIADNVGGFAGHVGEARYLITKRLDLGWVLSMTEQQWREKASLQALGDGIPEAELPVKP